MSESTYFFTICLPLGTILLVVAIRSFSAVRQAKARLAHDDAYRRIAAQAATTHAETAAALSAIQATVSEIATRLGAVEKILKDVE
jgi:ParB-like chromosome segregation protein Spo0J